MQNLAIFLESNKDAAYYRQQVSERGILEKIDALNGVLLKIEGATVEDLPQIYEVLNEVETSLNKNANDPRTRMALNSFKPEPEKELEKKPVVDTEEDLKNPDTENLKGTDPDGGVTGEPGPEGEVPTGEPIGEIDPTANAEGPANDTQEPTDEGTKEPTGEPDPAEKVDTTEPTDESTGKPADESTNETTETPEKEEETTQKTRRSSKKKDAE